MVKNLAEKRPITLGGREPYFRRFLAAVQLLQQITNLVQVDVRSTPIPASDGITTGPSFRTSSTVLTQAPRPYCGLTCG
jgi:hypothetical protein